MSKLISTLEQLHRIRTRSIDDLSRKLASQKRLCQRFENNIAALMSLAESMTLPQGANAVLMFNQDRYKRNIQHVIDWQKQEQALASLETCTIQNNLLHEAKRGKSLGLILESKRVERQNEVKRHEQKTTDALSTQCWLRQQVQRHR